MAGKSWAWWKLPSAYKDLLQSKRLGGMFGGRTGVGFHRYAPYFWGQEYGNPAASIEAQHFVGGTLPGFVNWRFPQIMNEGFTL